MRIFYKLPVDWKDLENKVAEVFEIVGGVCPASQRLTVADLLDVA